MAIWPSDATEVLNKQDDAKGSQTTTSVKDGSRYSHVYKRWSGDRATEWSRPSLRKHRGRVAGRAPNSGLQTFWLCFL